MLDRDTRLAILHLRREGHGVRTIARALHVSRNSVRDVLASGTMDVPDQERQEQLDPKLDRVKELHAVCKGSLVRVMEKLGDEGIAVPYSTLTAFCRRHGIGVKPKERAGQYHFEPGEEMQHDTSPHDVVVGGKKRRLQCASLVLCFSRMIYAQVYPSFDRFWCKVFLTEAILDFQGSAERCMVDNSSVVIAHGTGKNAVPAPEMVAFGERFGFHFEAHELGDANRSAHVERGFLTIENNFYVGREFADLKDLNRQLVTWCHKRNAKYRKHIRTIPTALYQVERPHLKPLPIYVPEVWRVHDRVVGVEGYVHLYTNRYSVDEELIDRDVKVHEGKSTVRIFHGHDLSCEHERREDGAGDRVTKPEHVKGRRWRLQRQQLPESEMTAQERVLRVASPAFASMVDALKRKHGGRAARPVRVLHRMYMDYPLVPLRAAVEKALAYGLLDLQRVEQMVLRGVAGDYFQLSLGVDHEEEEERQAWGAGGSRATDNVYSMPGTGARQPSLAPLPH